MTHDSVQTDGGLVLGRSFGTGRDAEQDISQGWLSRRTERENPSPQASQLKPPDVRSSGSVPATATGEAAVLKGRDIEDC